MSDAEPQKKKPLRAGSGSSGADHSRGNLSGSANLSAGFQVVLRHHRTLAVRSVFI